MNPFHKFLLKHRRYCEKCNIMTLTPATEVIRENGHDIAVCKIHAEPLKPIQAGLERRFGMETQWSHPHYCDEKNQ